MGLDSPIAFAEQVRTAWSALAKAKNVCHWYPKFIQLGVARCFITWTLMSRIIEFQGDLEVCLSFDITLTLGHCLDRCYFEWVMNPHHENRWNHISNSFCRLRYWLHCIFILQCPSQFLYHLMAPLFFRYAKQSDSSPWCYWSPWHEGIAFS
jgi:hypothetical protein